MSSETLYAYLAGSLDADGCFGIKKSTHHIRKKKDAFNATYYERVALKQVTPQVPKLLHDTFGGSLRQEKSGGPNRKTLWAWSATGHVANNVVRCVLPHLRIKSPQAECLLELRKTFDAPYNQISYWFLKDFPNWHDLPMVTDMEASYLLGYTNKGSLAQAIKKGTVLIAPLPKGHPRIPKLLIDKILSHQSQALRVRARCKPDELIAWRESLWEGVKTLNTCGVEGTPVSRREGIFEPVFTPKRN